jgi:hypothetical protein
MRQNARDLANASIYLAAIGVLVASIALSVSVLAGTVASGPLWSGVSAFLEPNKDEEQTKMSHMIESSREIRAALSKPQPPRPPLQPITASVAHGRLLAKGRHQPHAPQLSKLPPQAMDAFAQHTSHESPIRVRANPEFDRHKVY